VAAAVLPLAVAMIHPSFRTVLVPAVGRAPLPASRFLAAGDAAVALPTVAV
jgi:hypothetical protein